MSLSNRATSKGGKGAKADKSHKSDKTESGRGSGDKQYKEKSSKYEDPSLNDKVNMLMEMTKKSEDEVCLALHECDYDLPLTAELLLAEVGTGEWETRVKKKKSRQASAGKQGDNKGEDAPVADDWNDAGAGGQTGDGTGGGNNRGDRDKPRGGGTRSGGPPRMHNRGWRGRERHENERNLEEGGRSDFQRDRDRRGRSGGDSTRGRGGRGRGGGRAGGRYPPRGNRTNNTYNQPIETWENTNTWDNNTTVTTNHNMEETWDEFPGADEWSTEEYTGSLADTKVFTPSAQPTLDQISEPTGVETVVSDLQSPLGQPLGQTLQMCQPSSVQIPSQSPVPPMVGSLTPAQTQYFSQLQQNNDSLNKQYGSGTQTFQSQTFEKPPSASQFNNTGTPAQSFTNQQYVNQNSAYVNSSYQTVSSSYGQVQSEPTPAQQPTRTKTQRARVPPPSKIPSSAVEMPGDLNSSIGYLDVQFGAMDLIDTNTSFDSTMDSTKYNNTQTNNLESSTASTANIDLNTSTQNPNLDVYSPKTLTQSSISSALSQSLTSENIPPTSEHLSNAYNSAPRSTTQGSVSTVVSSVPSSGLDLNKQPETHSYSQSSSYNAYQSKASTYNSSTYSGTQTTSSYVSNQANAYVNNQSGSYNPPSGNSYQNAYSSNPSYPSTANSASYPSISQSNTYPSNNQSYQQNTSQSVYGANTGLNSGSSYGNTNQYNNYSSSTKLVKETYEPSSCTSSTNQTTTTHVTSATSLSLSQTTVGSSKTSTTLAKNSNSIVSNIPPGVAPVMSTPYIMGQMQYFQQPVYSYEDMQLLQQRIPHMTTPFYDMSYQTPTTLAAVRDAAALGNVGYSISDGRFTRTDNNASPVPSTLSQQTSTLTQGHQAQPILAAGTAPPYFFTAFNTIAPNYPFGTMYTQLPAATNAHGSSNSTQYQKPATYGSGYGSYDALNQSQDYTKGGYVGNTQAQKGSGGNASSAGSAGSDLAALYSKPHTALGKVNSYEKQAFHSGTPPPFTGAIHGSQNAGLAPSGTGYPPQVYIPTMAAQHHSTHLMQQPLHQDSGNSGSQRSQASNQAKAGAKQPYQASYWNQA